MCRYLAAWKAATASSSVAKMCISPMASVKSEPLELGRRRRGRRRRRRRHRGLELAGELDEGLAAGVVDVVDGVREQDEPRRRLRARDESDRLLGEACCVGVEEPDAEAVDDEARLGLGALLGGNGDDLARPRRLVMTESCGS